MAARGEPPNVLAHSLSWYTKLALGSGSQAGLSRQIEGGPPSCTDAALLTASAAGRLTITDADVGTLSCPVCWSSVVRSVVLCSLVHDALWESWTSSLGDERRFGCCPPEESA